MVRISDRKRSVMQLRSTTPLRTWWLCSGEPVYEGEDRAQTPSSAPPQEARTAEPSSTLEPAPCLSGPPGTAPDIAPIKAMLNRLEKRGVHVTESMNLSVHDLQEFEDREEALIKAFHALDIDGRQCLSMQQLRGLVCLDSPQVNQHQVHCLAPVLSCTFA